MQGHQIRSKSDYFCLCKRRSFMSTHGLSCVKNIYVYHCIEAGDTWSYSLYTGIHYLVSQFTSIYIYKPPDISPSTKSPLTKAHVQKALRKLASTEKVAIKQLPSNKAPNISLPTKSPQTKAHVQKTLRKISLPKKRRCLKATQQWAHQYKPSDQKPPPKKAHEELGLQNLVN